MHSQAKLTHKPDIGQQQIHAHRDPDLRHHCIARGAQKGFDLQVLLDPFEEQFNLPAFLVNCCNGAGSQMESIGKKDIMLTGFGVTVPDTSQKDLALIGFRAGQADHLIGGDAGCSGCMAAFDDGVTGVLLLSGNEVNAFCVQVVILYVVGISAVEDDNTATGQIQFPGQIDLMYTPLGDLEKRWQVAIMIQANMEFDSTLGGSELRPGEHRQAQVDSRGVQ